MVVLYAVSGNYLAVVGVATDLFSSRGLLGFVVYGIAMVTVPADEPQDPNGTVDWAGAYLGVGALILFNFVWKYVSSNSQSYRTFVANVPIAKHRSLDGASLTKSPFSFYPLFTLAASHTGK